VKALDTQAGSRGAATESRASGATIAWLVAALCYFSQYFLRTAPAVMMPQLRDAFGLSAVGVASLVGLFYYGYAPFSLVAGTSVDRFGPRRVVAIGVSAVAAGALLFGTGNLVLANFGRVLQGAGGVFTMVGAVYLAAKGFQASSAATMIGATQMFGASGGAAGQFLVGRMLASGVPWYAFFMGMGVVGLVLAAAAVVFLPKQKPDKPQHGWLSRTPRHNGRPWQVFFLHVRRPRPPVALSRTPRHNGRPWQVFFLHVRRPRPPVALKSATSSIVRVFGNPQTILCGLIAGLFFVPTTIFDMIWGVRFLQEGHGFDYGEAVIRSATVPLGWLIGSPLMGLLSDRLGRRKPVIVAAGCGLIACLGWILYGRRGVIPPYVTGICTGILSGAAMLLYTVGKEANPPDLAGTITGAISFQIFIFSALLNAVFGRIMNNVSGGNQLVLAHYQMTFQPLLYGVGLAVVLTLALKETGTLKTRLS
jgi:MFS family permease